MEKFMLSFQFIKNALAIESSTTFCINFFWPVVTWKQQTYCYISPYNYRNWLLKKLMIIIWTLRLQNQSKNTFKTFLVSLRKLFGMMKLFALKQRSLWQPTYSADIPINCWSVVKSSLQVSWVQIVNLVSCTIIVCDNIQS